jgi:hypothetical protein
MRGIPNFIQTRDDLRNLFNKAKAGELDTSEVAELVRTLLARQYHTVRIVSVDGAKVTTRYFPECQKGASTACGLSVKSVAHVEDSESEGDSVSYSETIITLSKAPADDVMLSVFMEENFLTRNSFDIDEIIEILEVLENA